MRSVLDKIEKQSGYDFWYNKSTVDEQAKISLEVNSKPLDALLKLLFDEKKTSFEIIDKTIFLKPHPTKKEVPDNTQNEVLGTIVDHQGKPIPNATIRIKGTNLSTSANDLGQFRMTSVESSGILIVSSLGFSPIEITFSPNNKHLSILLESEENNLEDVQVVSTGYQTLEKRRTTGSFVLIDSTLINRKVSTNIIDRLEGITNGLIINKNKQAGQSNISIRGRSTIFADAEPLIILDNFPYLGDIQNINPNDIENISILKDAAAASIWGATSGNGVIVITTKKGKISTQPIVGFNTNLTLGAKPNLYYLPQLSSSQWIAVEEYLFNQGKFTSVIDNGYQYMSPAVSIFQQRKLQKISAEEAKNRLDQLQGIDIRSDLDKYLYRTKVYQQYSANVSGGSDTQRYNFSVGYDKNMENIISDGLDRATLNFGNSYYLLNKKLELSTGLLYNSTKGTSNNISYVPSSPYDQIADSYGNPLAVQNRINGNLNKAYADTAGKGRLLDWHYYPLDDFKPNTINKTDGLTLNFGVSYSILKSLKISTAYQRGSQTAGTETNYDLASFYTRDLINRFSSISGNTITYHIPNGSIADRGKSALTNNYGRAQLNFNPNVNDKNEISGILGIELRESILKISSTRLYGFNAATETNSIVDYLSYFPIYSDPLSTSTIPYFDGQFSMTDQYRSYYFLANYGYDRTYYLSASARRDESNLFGVNTNQKGVPLWSIGGAWIISNEHFLENTAIDFLKIRTSYGLLGNVDKSVSSYLTATQLAYQNQFLASQAQIINAPNPSLRWEKTKTLNVGMDFSVVKKRLSGTFEYFKKWGVDLIGNSPIAPQTGVVSYRGNSANTSSNGIDLTLNSVNFKGALRWESRFNLNLVKDKITEYKVKQGSNSLIVGANYLNPLVGYPYISIFSYKWNGLDTLGNPIGSLNGVPSSDYTAIRNSTNLQDLVYNGPAAPTIFGNLMNVLEWKSFGFSFNITYKLGYYFRRASLNNTALYSGASNYAQADFENRWQTKGDERTTDVPALIYPTNSNRDDFYERSSILIEKADHIRLQDIQLSYTVSKKKTDQLPFKQMRIYFYANNLGILWKSTPYKIDPDSPYGYPNPKTIAFGIQANF
ncbi:SusC/RagA family TonB-linked outer membrane protein [Pedobacter frigidisoli]|uniref:SusC/RagA family TonB-linked outer membrane protein n=1 Tax=Pedobacter frigidisoli TaxID=2530455 RepID=UPI00292CB38C|nr:SusC/RagA family TonB-linked outer membrane protein [Pedobacter frigidisoli]